MSIEKETILSLEAMKKHYQAIIDSCDVILRHLYSEAQDQNSDGLMQCDDDKVNEMADFFFQLFDPNSPIHKNAKLYFRSLKKEK